MKIIINQPRTSYFVGGAEMISLDHAINFSSLGHDVSLITISPKSVGLSYSKQFTNFKKKNKGKINIIELNQSPKCKYIYNIIPGEDRCRWNIESIYYNQMLYDYLNESKVVYDLMFSYYNLDAVFVPSKFIKNNTLYLCGIPREQNDFQGSFLSTYDNILAISSEVKESWKNYAKNGIKVVSTGVDCNKFTLKKKKNNKIKLLYVGRLISRKNIDLIIDAYNDLKNKYNIEFIVVGDGPEFDNLKVKSDDVIFKGIVSNPEKYYKEADIFVTPSKFGEGLQGTILEAMSSGLTIVATDTDINRELLSEGRGFLVKPELISLKEGIVKAINANREAISLKNRNYVLEKYDWIEKCNEILEDVK